MLKIMEGSIPFPAIKIQEQSSLVIYILGGERPHMDTTLHSVGLAVGDLEQSLTISQEVEETEHHIHLPNPSYWPLLLGAAVLVEVTGLLFVPEGPWLSIIAAPFVLLGILGWGLEDPMGHPTGAAKHVHKHRPTRSAQEIVDLANAAVES